MSLQETKSSERAGSLPKMRFGLFEADLQAQELRRSGTRIRLQSQPFKVLALMLERPGEVISREDMQRRIWGDQTNVDFDRSLGTTINKLREALGDSADNPRFIETLARRGYRFIAPVSAVPHHTPEVPSRAQAASETFIPAVPPPTPIFSPAVIADPVSNEAPASDKGRFIKFRIAALIFVLSATILASGIWLPKSHLKTPLRISQITFSGRVFPGEPLQESFAATATDGSRIYFPEIDNGQSELAEALIADGETTGLRMPSEITSPSLGSISADNSKLLVRNSVGPAEQPLWIIPTLGGTGRSIPNILAHDATWMPDGQHILYANGMDLFVANQDGTGSRKLATVPGRAFWLRWSPDGKLLRFTVIDPLNHTTSIWQISASGRNLHNILPNWSAPASECCGSWTSEGRYYVFQSAKSGMNNIWAIATNDLPIHSRSPQPVQITNGPLSYQSPITSLSADRLFFIGRYSRSILLQFDSHNSQFLPYGKTLNAAQLVTFSRTGDSVAWINPEDSSLWTSRIDGTQRIQLTSSPMEVFMMHWSPDGKHIVLMGRQPGKLWRIYTVDVHGGGLVPVLNEVRNEADPDWSPDGTHLVFGRLPDIMAEKSFPKSIYILDLKTRQLETLPHSEGLFSPRWSPDGRYIVAITLDQSKLMVFDTATQTWRILANLPAHDPVWSRNSRWLYFDNFQGKDQPIYRVSVPEGHLQRVAGLNNLQPLDALDFRLVGLTPADAPLISARSSTANIYSLDLNDDK